MEKRKEKPFEDFDDLKKRVQNLPDPRKAIEKRREIKAEAVEKKHDIELER